MPELFAKTTPAVRSRIAPLPLVGSLPRSAASHRSPQLAARPSTDTDLNRGGDRQANAALWRIALVRLSHDPTTRAYMAKRISEGKSKTEALRCLKRYIARQVFNALPDALLDEKRCRR